MTDKHRVEIVQMDRFFLYLPVHYACERGFFGYVPKNYEILVRESRDRSDESAYKELTSRLDIHKDVHFALCDPTFVLKNGIASAGVTPAILAGIITNAAFWAVNHRSGVTNKFSDLGTFEKIIAYKRGTTSYRIAHRIFRDSKRTDEASFIETVSSVGAELESLRHSSKRTLAISPAILEIDALLGSMGAGEDFDVELALGVTPEYSNVLVTALLSRQEFVAAHPELISGMLKAIQRAMILVRFYDSDVINFATDYYANFGYRAPGALARATDAHVFPWTVEVSQAHWENAVRAASEAEEEIGAPDVNDQIRNGFDRYIKPYLSYARFAARDEMLSGAKTSPGDASIQPTNRLFLVGIGASLGLGLFSASLLVHWSAALAAGVELIAAAVLLHFFELRGHRILQILHIMLWAAIVMLTQALIYCLISRPGSPYIIPMITLTGTICASDIAMLVNLYRKEREANRAK